MRYVVVVLCAAITGPSPLKACEVTTLTSWSKYNIEIGEAWEPQQPDVSGDTYEGNGPRAIAADSKGNIYVGDSVNYRVIKVSRDGRPKYVLNLQKAS